MNIFFLSYDPVEAAQLLIDKHVVKMRAESIQMIASVHKKNGVNLDTNWPPNSTGNSYKGGYANHPCTIWAGDNSANYLWLCNHLTALENEYRYRYGKVNSHTTKIVDFLFVTNRNFVRKLQQSQSISTPALAMPVDCYTPYENPDPVLSYRCYYIHYKKYDINGKNMCKYTKRDPPKWLTNLTNPQ